MPLIHATLTLPSWSIGTAEEGAETVAGVALLPLADPPSATFVLAAIRCRASAGLSV